MSRSRTIRFLSLLILQMSLSGCYTYRLLQTDLPPGPAVGDSIPTIRVTTVDGDESVLRNPWLNEAFVGGEGRWQGRSGSVQIPLSQVSLIEEKEFDRRRTIGLFTLVIGALVAGVECSQTHCWSEISGL